MEVDILEDVRLRAVPWRDLVALTPSEAAAELLLSLPFLAGSLWLGQRGITGHAAWLAPALVLSFAFFLTGLRQVHNAFHYALGLPRPATEWAMFALSLLMGGSMHAVQTTHLLHHRRCLGDGDVEGGSARLGAWDAVLLGPRFPYRLHRHAWAAAGRRQRRWIAAELVANVAWIVLVLAVLRVPALHYHVVAMAVGQSLTGFFAVWTVHHGCDPRRDLARTLRHRVKRILTFDMFLHLEHHLFPRIPTCHLHALAVRLDRAAPGLARKRVF